MIIGATNRLSDIDPAMRASGRIDREIELKVPSEDARYEILLIYSGKLALHDDVNLKDIARETQGFVGGDIEALVRDAALLAFKETANEAKLEVSITPDKMSAVRIKASHFLTAMDAIKQKLKERNAKIE